MNNLLQSNSCVNCVNLTAIDVIALILFNCGPYYKSSNIIQLRKNSMIDNTLHHLNRIPMLFQIMN